MLEEKSNGEASLREVLKLAVGVSKNDGVNVEGSMQPEDWRINQPLKRQNGFEEIPAPNGFSGTLGHISSEVTPGWLF